ncbi:hypothetical protein ACJ72_05939 [Emergomyces africanus]|uniref:Uncharacterized protein n=1 Tax=Emergomyces africanus TaxID=1955775 RepID=A0A1B7NSW3_9EURO|nr:hypothetical protein ACJ72_05939 [Emergomyces africanus]
MDRVANHLEKGDVKMFDDDPRLRKWAIEDEQTDNGSNLDLTLTTSLISPKMTFTTCLSNTPEQPQLLLYLALTHGYFSYVSGFSILLTISLKF